MSESSKANSSILIESQLIITFLSNLQSSNALSPTYVTELVNVISVKLVCANAAIPIFVTESGIVNSLIAIHLSNAWSPILVTVFPIVIFEAAWQ